MWETLAVNPQTLYSIKDTDIKETNLFFYYRGGITVITENGKDTRSHLIIKNARASDSGNYTCKPSIFQTATVRLHVLNGRQGKGQY